MVFIDLRRNFGIFLCCVFEAEVAKKIKKLNILQKIPYLRVFIIIKKNEKKNRLTKHNEIALDL